MKRRPLFIFEMANNHQGMVEHGKKIISEIRKVCDDYPEFDYAFKFQYRDLDTFIHPAFKDRMDIKNVKRFNDTRLTREQFKELLDFVKANRFLAICTPFDEISADRIAEEGYDYIKIASCSFNDWPLLERIASKNMPVIASGAGSTLENVKAVVNFFQNRNIDLSLMHCVAEYPTSNEHLELNQIDFYKSLFPGLRVGFSTHESPSNMMPIRLAVAKGAEIFEKHVGVPTDTITLNGYSANPSEVRSWLEEARISYEICGTSEGRYLSTEKEQSDLAALRRGVFALKELKKGEILTADDYYLAFPCTEGSLTAADLSKYNKIELTCDVAKDAPVMREGVTIKNTSKEVLSIVKDLLPLLKEANVVVPTGSSIEISHHYGLEKFREIGLAMIDCVNREYCKKILELLPGQDHPTHYHVKKEETFVVLHGDLKLDIDGEKMTLHKGDVFVVLRNKRHSFSSDTGCVFEEISTTHYVNDSFYDEQDSFVNPRKTKVHLTKEMLDSVNGR